MPNSEPYWFPAHTYGWGWGPPVKWQGWVVLLIWLAALFWGLSLLRHSGHPLWERLIFVLVMSVILGFVCYVKGEPPKWRWGERDK